MELFQEYALLIAIAVPVWVIVLVNIALYLTGERGTLLLPWVHDFPPVLVEPPEAQPVEAAALPEPAQAPAELPLEDQPVEELQEAA